MAIINSLAVGKARKSAGNLTYRLVRGRTIASEKIGARPKDGTTRAPGEGLLQIQVLAVISAFMRIHKTDIQVSFNKTKYGSQRNFFMKINYKAFKTMVQSAALVEGMTDEEINTAVGVWATANPNQIVRVRLAGFDSVYLNKAWSSDDNPISGGSKDDLSKGEISTVVGEDTLTAPCAASLNFHAGAKIVRAAGVATINISTLPAAVTAGQISYLTSGGVAVTPAPTVVVKSSAAGKLVLEVSALTEEQKALGLKIQDTYYRLTSAYVKTGGEAPDPDL